MAAYPHIAVCVEDSAGSRLALAEAARVRAIAPGRLSVLHVVGTPAPPPYLSEGGSFMPDGDEVRRGAGDWLAEQAAAAPGATPVVLEGYPPQAVCEWAAANGVSLLVAGAERGRIERLLLGSFSTYLSRHAPCSVLLVRVPRR
ncbi:MAG: universal stress protein [Thermoleophilia bacterium]|nr:universal stress protein [Thermoleophilia bacterium]